MPAMSFQDFRAGIARRKSQQIVDQTGLYDCKNAFVNSGFAIKKRSGSDKITGSSLTADSKGLFEFDEIFLQFFSFRFSTFLFPALSFQIFLIFIETFYIFL